MNDPLPASGRGTARRFPPVMNRTTAALLLALSLALPLWGGCAATKLPGKGGVAGTVYAPAEGVFVYVYHKGTVPHGPADVILPVPTLADGTFAIDLPPGEYTVVARKRSAASDAGPLQAGDPRSDPVDITVGPEGKVVLPRLVMTTKEDTEYKSSFVPPKEWNTTIAGTVRDAEGNPVQGTRIHVYTYVQMSERPKYVSERTGPDGRYVVTVPKGGTYYIAARDRFGGPPRIGDLYGRYDEGSINPMGVVVKDGEHREGIDITVFRVW
jgi:hypothetical protein